MDVYVVLTFGEITETALGRPSVTDEVESFARGFHYAGAPSVIGSLWAVDDESTHELFSGFYSFSGDKAERIKKNGEDIDDGEST